MRYPSGNERPLTRHKSGAARFTYELRVNGTLLQGGDDLSVLLKNVSEKPGATITRTRDLVVVYPIANSGRTS